MCLSECMNTCVYAHMLTWRLEEDIRSLEPELQVLVGYLTCYLDAGI